jgi:TIR domain
MLRSMSNGHEVAGHAFISYVREDSQAVDRLERVLNAAGIRVWRDTEDLWPGQDWRTVIRQAITGDALAFIACFSGNSIGRERSYQNEELTLAVEQLRLRQPDDPWLIPVRLDDCVVPDWDIGRGRTLGSIQRADLFGDSYDTGVARLVATVLHILARRSDHAASSGLLSRSVTVLGQPDPAAAGTEAQAQASEPDDEGPAITSRWRLTHTLADATAMSQLDNQGFGHRAYSRATEQTPPWIRIKAAVACDRLGEIPRWQELRKRFADLLGNEPISGLISEMTIIPADAHWRARATQRRSWLEADLTGEDQAVVPSASAILFLPESNTHNGIDSGYALLTIHVDFAPHHPDGSSGERSFALPYWRARFAQALGVPGDLASWLEHQIGLTTLKQPAAQFGVLLHSGTSLTEIINTDGISKLPASYVQNQFTGWAVADTNGKTVLELASEMALDLSERVLYLDGTLEEMSGQT